MSCLKENELLPEWLLWDEKTIPFTTEQFHYFKKYLHSCFQECELIPEYRIMLSNEQETFIKIGLKFDPECECFCLFVHTLNEWKHYLVYPFSREGFHYLTKKLKQLHRSINLTLQFRIEVLL